MMNANTASPIVFIVRGQEAPAPTGGASRGGAGSAPAVPLVKVKKSIRLTSSRAAADEHKIEAVPGQDVVVLHIANGPTLTLHPETARDLILAQAASVQKTRRGAQPDEALGAIEVPTQLAWPDMEPAAAGRGGAASQALAAFFEVVTPSIEGRLADFVADQVVKKVDGQVAPGLYKLRQDALGKLKEAGQPVDLSGKPPAGGRMLVLIHGTFVDTVSTFGKLWRSHPAKVGGLFKAYKGEVYALDHPTLGVSPIANALELAKALPEKAKLHLLTHSRGGLVAEVLARVCGQTPQEADAFHESIKDLFPGERYEKQREDLEALAKVVADKKITAERMVRVACPAHGTLLASKRLDAYLSVFKWALELGGVPIAPDVVEFLGEVARRRADPAILPGLEAMTPGSPLLAWLQSSETPIPNQLRVVAGDIKGDSVISWVKTLLADAYYWTDNDLIVQTRSMYGGSPRGKGAPSFFLDRGGEVSHFNYFENEETVNAILEGLKDEPQGFKTIGPLSWAGEDAGGERAGKRGERPPAEPNKPAVFVLPGILGSNLAIGVGGDKKRIWLSPRLVGRLEKLRYKPGADDVEDDGPIGVVYDELIKFLGQSHDVIPFGFDWRKPLEEEARRLGGRVDEALKARQKTGQPVRLLAHSMGGLLARTMQLECPDVWRRLMSHKEARLLMLGTPNGGSWAPMQVLSGDDTFGNWLAGLGSPFNGHAARQWMAEMPGLIQLQASLLDEKHDLGKQASWQALASQDLAQISQRSWWHRIQLSMKIYDWGLPNQAVLDAAVNLRARLDGQRFDDPQKILLVVGQADFTPDGYRMEQDGLVYLNAPQNGDGRVTLANAKLENVRTWKLDCEHGNLPAHKKAFDAFQQLLEKGETALLPALGTVGRGGAAPPAPSPSVLAPSRPSRSRFADSMPPASMDALFGLPGMDPAAASPLHPALKVTVENGNLKFVRDALLIGHYRSLALTGSEKEVNHLIGGTMQASLETGLYPDSPGFQQVFINQNRQPDDPSAKPRLPAVIVVGLDEEGKLQAPGLAATVRQGVLAYAQRLAEQRPVPTQFELAATLVGSGGTRISAGLSAQMVAQGVRDANARLQAAKWPQVSHLRLIELFLSRATEAWHALQNLADSNPGQYTIAEQVKQGTGPLKHPLDSSYRGTGYDFITAIVEDGPDREPTIAYTLDTRRARTEIRAQSLQGRLLAELVKSASNDYSQDAQIGRTLFQLLVPPEMEPFIAGTSDMLIELNPRSAAIPWELLDIDDKTRADGNREPWAIRCKLLRKLRIDDFRGQVQDAGPEDAVLVIGEPFCDKEKYPPLPGALDEAKAVAEFLRGGVSNVKSLIEDKKDFKTIINAFSEHSYRAVHIAGHGEPGAKGGVVLSDGIFLSSREINNMRTVPELVFVNCCHLAAQDPDRLHYDRATFAATMAETLIKIGVRCVIAAGWAVNDVSAKTFATTFYQRLLAGARFIDAVGEARKAAYAANPNDNTWAAYQCYGDPDWRWRQAADPQQPAPANPDDEFDGIATQEALRNALHTLKIRSQFPNAAEHTGIADPVEERKKQLGYLESRFAPIWGHEGAVAEDFGMAFESMKERDRAIEWYEKALAAEDGGASMKVSEQLGNLRVCRAFEKFAKAQGGEGAEAAAGSARKEIQEALGMLELLVSLKPSSERLSLCGSAYKRLAMLEYATGHDPAVPDGAIERMASYYRKAEALALDAQAPDLFSPALNRMAAELILNFKNPQWQGFDEDELEPVRRNLEDKEKDDPDFEANRYELVMYEALASRKLAGRLGEISRGYEDLRKRVNQPRLWSSVSDQARFILDHYPAESPGEPKAVADLLALLNQYANG